ncbi:MAG TPA: LapA family protein [Phycisphaerales bacterium]|nr:LapA family protein [Phycisphaerales bacterium]
MKKATLILVLVLSVIAIVLALMNFGEVTVRLLFATVTTPLAFLVLLVFAIGAIVGAGAALILTAKSKPPRPPA